MTQDSRAALLSAPPRQCLVLRFSPCPNAHPARCSRCSVMDQARMATLLARPYWRRRAAMRG